MSSPAVSTRSFWPPPLTVGVYGITVVCGLLDAASFLGLGLIFVETMTGNILLLAFSLGVHGTDKFAHVFPSATVWPYLVALGAFGAGAVAGGRLVRAEEPGRRAGFAIEASMIGVAVLVVVLTHPGPANDARYPVIAILACAMGLQNTLMRRWGIPDLATNWHSADVRDCLSRHPSLCLGAHPLRSAICITVVFPLRQASTAACCVGQIHALVAQISWLGRDIRIGCGLIGCRIDRDGNHPVRVCNRLLAARPAVELDPEVV